MDNAIYDQAHLAYLFILKSGLVMSSRDPNHGLNCQKELSVVGIGDI